MAINVSVQYNGGLLPDIILLTQCYFHRGTRLNAMKSFFCICSLSLIPPKRFDIFSPLTGGCSEGLGVFFCVRIKKSCVCVCVFFPFILDIKFVGRTSRGHTGGSHGISHPPSFCGACLTFSREKDSAIPFPRRP